MKRIVLPIIVLLAAGVAVFFLFFKKEEKLQTAGETLQPLSIEENTSVFNQSYNQLLAAYFGVRDALVASDTSKASAAALQLVVAADSLKINEIQGDATLKETARTFTGTITGSAKALAAGPDLKVKRKEFEIIADALWTLTRTVKYDGQKLYWHYCPMAFNRGAYWVSNKPEIRNPYYGDEMLDCGRVADSLDYSKK